MGHRMPPRTIPDRELAQIASNPLDYYVDVHKDDKAS